MKTKLSKFLLVAVLFFNCTKSEKHELVLNRREVIDDMFAVSHEGTPHGVRYTWGSRPTFGKYTGDSTNPADWENGFDNWANVQAWGQVYASNHNNQCRPRPGDPDNIRNCVHHELCSPETSFPNIRVHLKDMELYIYRNDNTWERLDYSDFIHATNPNHYGHWYVEDFVNDENKRANIQFEPEGGISIQAGSGWNFHFWGNQKNADPDNVGINGIFAVCKARLIGVEGKQDPKYLLSVGADHFRTDGRFGWVDGNPIVGVGCGRFKYVTKQWQYYTFCTFRAQTPTRSAILAAAEAAIMDNPSFSEALLDGGIICK